VIIKTAWIIPAKRQHWYPNTNTVIIMDKRKGYVLLLINAGVRNSVSERKNLGGCSITCNGIPPPSVVSGYGKRSINLNKFVATFEKHIFLSQTDLTRTGIISNSYNDLVQSEYYLHFIKCILFSRVADKKKFLSDIGSCK
jgi:hypothetical protein